MIQNHLGSFQGSWKNKQLHQCDQKVELDYLIFVFLDGHIYHSIYLKASTTNLKPTSSWFKQRIKFAVLKKSNLTF